MKKTRYFREFAHLATAHDRMIIRNQTSADGTIYCLIEGPDDGGGTVCDLRTAIETQLPYSWGR